METWMIPEDSWKPVGGPPAAPTKPRKARKAPSLATMERWMSAGVAKATDGCRVEPDGRCPHGKKSWLLVLGLI
jgi:hypothetical protein